MKRAFLFILFFLFQIPLHAKTLSDPEVVDFLSGFKAIRVITDIAYCATEGGLKIYNVQNRTTPTILSSTIVSESLNVDIEIKDRYAYVLSGSLDLEKSYITVVDIGNPSKPRVISRYSDLEDGNVSDILIYDHYLIVANGGNIDLLDFTKPAHLKRISRFPLTGSEGAVRSLTLTGKILFASWENLEDSALVSINLSDVKKLKRIDTFFYPGLNGKRRSAGPVIVSNSMVFAAVPTLGLLIFDAGKPDDLRPISRTHSENFRGIEGLYAEAGLLFVDLKIPGKKYKSGQRDVAVFDSAHGSSLPLLHKVTTFASANGMDFDPEDQQAFMGISSSKGFGLGIYQVKTDGDLDPLSKDIVPGPVDVAAQKNLVFLTASQNLIAAKIVKGKVKVLSQLALSKNAGSIQIQDSTAFLTASDQRGTVLIIVDVTNPDSLKRLSEYRLAGVTSVQAQNSFAVKESFLYVVGKDGLRILDISNLNSPNQIGFLPISASLSPGVITVEKGTAYVGTLLPDQTTSKSILDFLAINISDPRSPKLITQKTIGFASVCSDITFQNGFAYLLYAGFGDSLPVADGQLAILDVRNTAASQVLYSGFTRKQGKGFAEEIAIRGNLAFIADGPEGVTVLSVADKTNPKILETLATPGNARSVSLDENNGVHVADGVSYLEYVVN